ncbi:hypothetical protein WJX84_009730 [Apatococcus fuscideae]|uniref:Programmed cell death protein 2 C-terminal domain-containing protein n=1 Tax=Apatococcus fuscideae TaxID=2026836 RepID=A0AAW1TFD5_9CHLO
MDSSRQASVLLGMPGDMLAADDPGDLFSTKVGGQPIFPGLTQPPLGTSLQCRVCSGHLSLVLQAFAPLIQAQAGEEVPTRLLYIFGCLAAGCGLERGSWRAFRYQLKRPCMDVGRAPDTEAAMAPLPAAASERLNGRSSSHSAPTNGSTLEHEAVPKDWGPSGGIAEGGDSWGGNDTAWGSKDSSAERGAQGAQDPLDFSDLGAALDELAPSSHSHSFAHTALGHQSQSDEARGTDTGGNPQSSANGRNDTSSSGMYPSTSHHILSPFPHPLPHPISHFFHNPPL